MCRAMPWVEEVSSDLRTTKNKPWWWVGGGIFAFFFPFSQCVLIMFPCVPQVVPQDVPNSTSILSHMVCPSSTPMYIN